MRGDLGTLGSCVCRSHC